MKFLKNQENYQNNGVKRPLVIPKLCCVLISLLALCIRVAENMTSTYVNNNNNIIIVNNTDNTCITNNNINNKQL